MPPRNDPLRDIYRDTAIVQGPRGGERVRPGYLEHRDIADFYMDEMEMDESEKRQFFAEYAHFMVSNRFHGIRNATDSNPFWNRWGINPDTFNWRAWRSAMGYEEGNRR